MSWIVDRVVGIAAVGDRGNHRCDSGIEVVMRRYPCFGMHGLGLLGIGKVITQMGSNWELAGMDYSLLLDFGAGL